MTIAATSNYTTARRDVAWGVRLPDGATRECTTSGGTFVRTLQAALRARTTDHSYDGQPAGGTRVAIDGAWGPQTQRAVWGRLVALGAPQAWLDVVEADARARRLSATSVRAASFVLARAQETPGLVVRPDDVVLSATVIPPTWGATTPATPTIRDACATVVPPTPTFTPMPVPPGSDAAAAQAGAPTPETPPQASQAPPAQAPSPALPAPPGGPTPTGIVPWTGTAATSGVSRGLLAGAAVVLAVTVGAAALLLRPKAGAGATKRRAPARRRRSR